MLCTLLVHAQEFTISGTVTTASGKQPLSGATVQLDNTRRYAITDDFGQYSFSKVGQGEHTLSVKYVGYTPRVETISVSGNVTVDFLLEEDVQLTDEVVIYATRASEKTPTTFTNINHGAIQKQNFGQDLPFLLNWTPSLVTTSDAGAGVGYTGIRIRGSDATRINVTINGIPYNDSESQGTFWVNIADIASSVQSIQIQRGVGTSTNGAGAFGASVNLQTSTLNSEPYAEVSLSGGSFNTFRTILKAGTGLINNRWAFDARVSDIRSDGYIDRASSDLRSYFASGAYHGNKTVVKAVAFGGHEVTYQAWYGVDEETMRANRTFNYAGALYDQNWNITRYYDKEEDNYRQDNYQLHVSQQLTDYWTANVSLHYTYGRGYYEQYKQNRAFSRYGLPGIVLKDTILTRGDFITRKWLDNHFYGTTFSLSYDKANTAFTLGGGYNEYAKARHFGEIVWAQYASTSSVGHEWYDGDGQKNDFNIYGKLNYDLTSSLMAFVDLQLRTVSYRTSGVDDDLYQYDVRDQFSFFNPKAGLSYTLSDNNVVYGSFAVAHREPNRVDYLDGYEKPKAERLENIELGWRKATPRYSFEANYYFMNYRDQLVLTGELNDVGNPIRANVGKSYRTGIELSAALRLAKSVTWNVNTTVSRNQNKDYPVTDENGNPSSRTTAITLSPDIIAGSQLNWTPFRDFQVSVLSKYVSEQYLDNTENSNLMLDAYFVNDLRFNYALPVKALRNVEASLLVNNIFSAKYASNGYSYDGVAYYYPQATRNFLAMITVRF
jgi:iron complex outermembrane recepter protein